MAHPRQRPARKLAPVTVTMYSLVRNGKTLMSSTRKLDVVFAHQKYTRKQGVNFVESEVAA